MMNIRTKSDDRKVNILTVLAIIGIVAAIIAVVLGLDFLFWKVYEETIPVAFHWPRLGFWQFVGVLILISVVGGFFKATVSNEKK